MEMNELQLSQEIIDAETAYLKERPALDVGSFAWGVRWLWRHLHAQTVVIQLPFAPASVRPADTIVRDERTLSPSGIMSANCTCAQAKPGELCPVHLEPYP